MKNSAKAQSIALMAVLLFQSGCSKGDSSLELENSFGKVQNGTAYDRASVPIQDDTLIIVPINSITEPNDSRDSTEIFLAKTISFGGHPPREIGIRSCRKYFGAAINRENRILKIATFGEWDSRIEGAAWVNMIIKHPAGLKIERRSNLSGDSSESIYNSKESLIRRFQGNGPYWYNSTECAAGWDKVHEFPDDKQTAKRVVKIQK